MQSARTWVNSRIYILFVLVFALCIAHIHVHNFDPTHPTPVTTECLLSKPVCDSQKDILLLILFAVSVGFFHLRKDHVFVPTIVISARGSPWERDEGVRMFFDPIRRGLRSGVIHSKYH